MKHLFAMVLMLVSLTGMAAQVDSFIFRVTGGGQIDVVVDFVEDGFALQVTSCSFRDFSMEPYLIEDPNMIADLNVMFAGEAEISSLPVESGLTGSWRELTYFAAGVEISVNRPQIMIAGEASMIMYNIIELGQSFCDENQSF